MKEKAQTPEKIDFGKRIIIFMGPEGSGKTSIAKQIAEMSDKPYISTGDIIRGLAANDTGAVGEACRRMFSENSYLAPQMLLEIVNTRLSAEDTKNGFVMDGGLRTTEETRDFPETLKTVGRNMPVTVIQLKIPGWMSFQRLTGRKRNDDTVDGITKRLSKYYFELGQRAMLIEKHPNWKLLHIDATIDQMSVLEEVKNRLRNES